MSGGASTNAALIEVGNAFKTWSQLEGATWTAVTNQLAGNSSAYVDIDQATIDAWFAAVSSSMGEGFVQATRSAGNANTTLYLERNENRVIPTATVVAEFELSHTFAPCPTVYVGYGGNLYAYPNYSAPAGGYTVPQFRFESLDPTPTVYQDWSNAPYVSNSSMNIFAGSTLNSADVTAHGIKVRVRFYGRGQNTFTSEGLGGIGYWVGTQSMGHVMAYDPVTGYNVSQTDLPAYAPYTVQTGRIEIATDPDNLIGWDGATAIAVVDGTTVYPVTASPTAAIGDNMTTARESWWEGLFGGISSQLQNVANRVSQVKTAVDDVSAAVVALPTTLTDLFNPAVGWTEFMGPGGSWSSVTGLLATRFPTCASSVFTNFSLFSGSTGPATFDFVYGTQFTLPVIAGVANVTKPASDVAMVVFFAMWAINRLRSIFGQGESTGTGE